MRSRERSAALKRSGYACESCGGKQSKAKGKEFSVEVHHRQGGINWEELIDMVYQRLLCNSDDLAVMCPTCHDKQHGTGPSSS